MKFSSKKILTLLVAIIVVVASLSSALGALAYVSDPPEGTVDKGIENVQGGESASSINGVNILKTKYQENGGFDDGLKYWTTTKGVANSFPSDVGSVKTEGTNKYFQFNGNENGGYWGIRTVSIAIPQAKLSIGDSVVVMFDYLSDGVDQLQVKSDQLDCSSGNYTNSMIGVCKVLKAATTKSSWKTLATVPTSGRTVVKSNAAAVADAGVEEGDYLFNITIAVPGGKTCTSGIDNIRLVKLKDGKYYDIETAEEITFEAVKDEEDLAWGTEEAGFKATGNVVTFYKPLAKAQNLDFSEGLRYWAGNYDTGTEAVTDYVALITDGTNKYINLKTTKEWGGITSPVFKVDGVNAGDEITLVYDRKLGSGTQKYQIYLSQIMYDTSYSKTASISGFNGRLGSDINGAIEVKAADASGWGTYALPINSALKTPAGADAGIYLKIAIQAQTTLPVDIDFDNFRIAKLSDGVYTDVLTGEVINPKTDNNSGTGTGTGTTTGTGTGAGTGSATGTSNKTGESITLLLSLFALSAAGTFGTAKALKKR